MKEEETTLTTTKTTTSTSFLETLRILVLDGEALCWMLILGLYQTTFITQFNDVNTLFLRDVLRLETIPENFEVLLEEPAGPDGMPVVPAPAWRPVLMDQKSRWLMCNAIVAKYCDGRRLRRRTWRVQIQEEWDNETKQAAVSEAEAELARWVAARHVEY